MITLVRKIDKMGDFLFHKSKQTMKNMCTLQSRETLSCIRRQ